MDEMDEMKLIDNVAMKLDKAVDLIEQARSLVLQVIDEDEIGACTQTCTQVDLKFDEISDFISDIGFDIIMAEFRVLERALESRLAELKAGGC